jgi:tetratricopeptide (TPR) repeat protein
MLKRLASGAMLALAACATASAPAVVTPIAALSSSGEVTKESLLALNSICSAEEATATARARDIELASGMGTGGFKVDTASKAAQDWFDYGLALSHAFYHEDAKRAMKKSVEADPSCSLCAWGEAWAWGPTINYSINEEQRAVALASAERAKSLVKLGDDKARRLADAAVARYQKDAKDGEKAFGDAMKAIAEAYPQDLEIASLASHAMLMSSDFGDKARLAQAIALMERVLKARPDDTGAIHYYIHATEWDGRAEDAIPYAERLGKLAPAASHLVHMPAHTYFRAGRYQDAAVVNAQAIAADMDWVEAGGDVRFPVSFDWMSPNLPPYYAHNLTFGLAGALMSGDAQLALKYAEHAGNAYPASLSAKARSGVVPRSWVALARYAPERALALPVIEGDPAFAAYRAYARGEALLLKGDAAGARLELKALRKVKAPAGDEAELTIAKRVLEARIAMAEGDTRKATKLFDRAAKLQEAELNDWMDPPAWWYPVRRSVAAAYLKVGDFAKAEAEARKSLSAWKHDPLALWVLGKAEQGLGRTAEGAAHLDEARKIWRGNFESITEDAI